MKANISLKGGKNINRQLLENALAGAGGVRDFAADSANFGGGRAGMAGLIAQGITAGAGAYAQYKNEQKLAQLDAQDAEDFAQFATESGNPELAKIASRLSPETRESYYLSMALPQSQNVNIPSSIREYEYFSKLTPESQTQFQGLKRNIAGEGAIINQQGQIQTLPGYGQAGAQRTGMEQTAKNISDLNYKPSISGESTFAQRKAEEDVKAQEQFSKINTDANNLTNLLDSLTTHPGVPDLFGAKGGGAILSYVGKKGPIAGSNAAGAKALFNQVKGQQFLQAFESLKGGGGITEKEGEAATNALSSLNENISEKELIKNINILKSTINKARNRAEIRASQGYQRGSTQVNNQNVDPNQMGLDLTKMVGNQRNPQQNVFKILSIRDK